MLASPETLTAPCTTTFKGNHPHRPLPQPTLFPSPQHQVIGQPHPRTTRLRLMWPIDSVPKELRYIKTTLQCNGYKPSKIKTSKPVPNTDKVSLTLSTSLPYLGSTSHKPDPSNRAWVYRMPCECGKVYIGETGRNLPTRLKEHRAHSRRGDFEKLSIVKHSHIKDHQIDWQAAQLITPINSWHTRRMREANKIFKHDTISSPVIFGNPDYGPNDLLHPKSTTLPPSPCA